MNQISATKWSPSNEKGSCPPNDAIRFDDGGVLPRQEDNKQLIWSGSFSPDWEILVYRKGDVWEACFFRWAIHHEHVTGSSFDGVQHRAEQRIRKLEAGRLHSTNSAVFIPPK
jgi:hypothetical protein